MGYEGACVWDSKHRLMIRYGGHNQGGGGEQGAEVWTFDPLTAKWELKEPNTSPPGVCCNAQNVYAANVERYIRFPLFSGSHGWQWHRELYLNDSSVWTYDLTSNRWVNMRPLPEPKLAPYRAASWDSRWNQVVVFGGEGGKEGTVIYDPYRNTWSWPKPKNEPPGRSGGNLAYDADAKLHILFGSQFTDDPHTWAYDFAKNEWRDMQPPSMPPTEKNDAVLTYDSIKGRVLALIKATSGEGDDAAHEIQTWSYHAGGNRWRRMNPNQEPAAAGNRCRNLLFAPELNLAILENCTGTPREQQVWTYRYAETDSLANLREIQPVERDGPPIVTNLVVSVIDPQQIKLRWTAPDNDTITGYLVERAPVEVWSEDQLTRLKSRTPPLESPSVGAIRKIGQFTKLTPEPVAETEYIDREVDLSQPQAVEGEPVYGRKLHSEHLDAGRAYRHGVFVYRIYAVDESGAASGPSPATFTIPSSPQHLFSRESGEACDLKWAANPEEGIAGYRVYRMDGRWNKDTVSRLTAEPTDATGYQDKTAGSSTRRYYVVAVDSLGQEGFPSSPVWHRREWRRFYDEPFTGEWHQ